MMVLALALVYDSMFHAANSLIRYQGYRPGIKFQHVGLIEAVKRTIGEDFYELILKYDKLRIKEINLNTRQYIISQKHS